MNEKQWTPDPETAEVFENELFIEGSNPFAEKAEALSLQADTGGEKPTCDTCGEELPYTPGVVRRFCNRTCRKNRNPKNRRKLSKNARP